MFFRLLHRSTSRCSPTVFYRNCWMHRLPGVLVDLQLSMSRGAHLVNYYHEKTAEQCSRTCCLLQNGLCNTAVFNFAPGRDTYNCFHINCPTQKTCIMRRKSSFLLFNITKGEDPDLLIFGNDRNKGKEMNSVFYTSASESNNSEPPGWDKHRHYNRYTVSLPPRTPLPTQPKQPPKAYSLPNTSHAPSSRTIPTDPPTAPASSEGDKSTDRATQVTFEPFHYLTALPQEESTGLTGTHVLKPLTGILIPGQANNTEGTAGENQTTDNDTGVVAPRRWGPATLLTPLLILSLILPLCVCIFLWAAARCRRKRGYYKPIHILGQQT
ncbi:MANSC domain-containing protein 4 [Callorhinchus milii]|nr:MANSC domain-containing protein 4 [Callorhinchus milii]